MARAVSRKRIAVSCIAFALFWAMIVMCLGEALMPQSGDKRKKNGNLTIDYSYMSDGYVMVKSAKSKKKLKVRVSMGDNTTLTYDLNTEGEYEVFPLQYGSGKYTFKLYKNVSGKKYAEDGKVTLSVDMEDENRAFLYPNQYINYDENTSAVLEAEKLCGEMTDEQEIFDTVCEYMRTHFTYDFVKSVTVKSGTLPDIEGTWTKHMGICQDLSAVMVCMLRSQGIPARMMIGTLNQNLYHAWVTAIVNGEEVFFDPTAALNAVNRNSTYTVERYY